MSTENKPTKPTDGLLALISPDGNVVHTKIGLKREEIIEDWLSEESTINWIGNLGRASRGESKRCLPSWEAYEAEGYTIQPIKITICQPQ